MVEITDSASDVPEPEPAIPLTEPRDGIPPITLDNAGLAEIAVRFAAGQGPVAVDAERASGYRYGQRAYLLQLRRDGAGSALIDPIGISDFAPLARTLAEPEWILHAASQDLPCLAEIGLRPTMVFDTELAARLLGRTRVGLGPLVEDVLGFALEKEHSAADWSTRPLPESWLRYAALDVEVLLELRAALAAELEAASKTEWARQEFGAIVASVGPAPRQDPWRRTSGMHRLRNRRSLAVVRSLWLARDRVARERDVAPGRVLADSAIVAAAAALPPDRNAMAGLAEFSGRGAQRRISTWWGAVQEGLLLPDSQLPPHALPNDAPPPPRSWPDRDPAAAARLNGARSALTQLSEQLEVPLENLLTPDFLRRVCWEPPEPATDEMITQRLSQLGARPWQIALTLEPIRLAIEGSAPK